MSGTQWISREDSEGLCQMEVGRWEGIRIIERPRPNRYWHLTGPAVRELFANVSLYSHPWPPATRKAAAWCRLRHYLKTGKVPPLDSFIDPKTHQPN